MKNMMVHILSFSQITPEVGVLFYVKLPSHGSVTKLLKFLQKMIRKVEDGKIDCLIAYDRKSLSMTQKGALNSKLQLIPGKETSNVYGTPMGDLTLSIFTHHYQVIEQAGSTKLIIDYSILAGDAPIQTAMEIEIKY